jgi:hypothetical protein
MIVISTVPTDLVVLSTPLAQRMLLSNRSPLYRNVFGVVPLVRIGIPKAS